MAPTHLRASHLRTTALIMPVVVLAALYLSLSAKPSFDSASEVKEHKSTSKYMALSSLKNTHSTEVDISTGSSSLEPIFTDTLHSLFPDKVYRIIGLESSGTTFLAKTIRQALGLRMIGQANKYEVMGEGFSSKYLDMEEEEGRMWTEVQHISLPWGGTCKGNHNPRDYLVDVVYPAICTKLIREYMTMLQLTMTPEKSEEFSTGPFGQHYASRKVLSYYKIPDEYRNMTLSSCKAMADRRSYPTRYSLNLNSHLEWYLKKGIDARAIIIMRDATISRKSRQQHCRNSTIMAMEEELGREILQTTIRKYIVSTPNTGGRRRRLVHSSSNGRVVVVSYELMNQLKGDYMKVLYHDLGINSTYEPNWEDGNVKHVTDEPPENQKKS